MSDIELVRPRREHLPGYIAALERGWSSDNLRPEATAEELARIAADPSAFLAATEDRDAAAGPITLPDGSSVPRLPSYERWIWDGEFCGSIGFRWKPGTEALPPTCLGHIGYAVVPWRRQRGSATRALAALLPMAREEGLRWVELTTKVENVPSRRVIEANGGVLMEEFTAPIEVGGHRHLRYRITFDRTVA